jgi:hypothetical protein
VLAVALAILLAAARAATAGSPPMHLRRSLTNPRTAGVIWLDLAPGAVCTFETRRLSRHADTRLVLIEEGRGAVAQNGDAGEDTSAAAGAGPGGRERYRSRITYTPVHRGMHALIVQAEEGTLPGTCDLYVNGRLAARNVAFGEPYRRPERARMPWPPRPRGAAGRPPEPVMDLYEVTRPPPRVRELR